MFQNRETIIIVSNCSETNFMLFRQYFEHRWQSKVTHVAEENKMYNYKIVNFL